MYVIVIMFKSFSKTVTFGKTWLVGYQMYCWRWWLHLTVSKKELLHLTEAQLLDTCTVVRGLGATFGWVNTGCLVFKHSHCHRRDKEGCCCHHHRLHHLNWLKKLKDKQQHKDNGNFMQKESNTKIEKQRTRSSSLNCALRGDEAVYWSGSV